MSLFQKIKKLSKIKIVILLMLLSLVLTALLPIFSLQVKANVAEKQKILSELSKKKDDLALKLKEARLKEAYASEKLRTINSKLHKAQSELNNNRKYLEANQQAWQRTKSRLEELSSNKVGLESEAKRRIVGIYKQNRLKLIDGLINSTTTTDYLDQMYYQKRVMQYDRMVLDALVDQSQNMTKYKKLLSEEANKISTINQKLVTLERSIIEQKTAQSQVLVKLQNETRIYEEGERQLERESVKLIHKITELTGDVVDNPEATGNFFYPVKARITSPFGPRRHPIFGVRSMHSGIDLAAPRGTPIKASEGGIVIYSGWYGGYGKVVIVDHSKGFSTLYAHLDQIAVNVGERIKQGKVVGYEGATGYATGPHLHFEVRSQGKPQNPISFLRDS